MEAMADPRTLCQSNQREVPYGARSTRDAGVNEFRAQVPRGRWVRSLSANSVACTECVRGLAELSQLWRSRQAASMRRVLAHEVRSRGAKEPESAVPLY